MDYKMPNLKGIEATTMIRDYLQQMVPEAPKPFIVCLSSYCNELPKKVIQKDDNLFDTVINKPIFKPGIFIIL